MPTGSQQFVESLEYRRHLSTSASTTGSGNATSGVAIDVPFAAAQSIIDLKSDVYGAIRENNHVPAGAALVMDDGAIAAVGSNGRRVADKRDQVTNDDRFHLGSAGKAMTSTLVARLIEEQRIDWNTTIGQVFPELRGKITRSFEDVTVWQLMTNRSGIRDDMSASTLVKLGTVTGWNNHAKREKMLPIVLNTSANGAPGEKFEYSNYAYAVLGAMAERVMNTGFETLMFNYVFKPLRMDTAGFGPQGVDSRVKNPRGHDAQRNPKTSQNDDLLPYLAPAGTMSMSVIDWSKFLKAQMGLSTKGKYLLKQSTLDRLHTPYDGAGTKYAAGWVVTEVLGVKILSHDGTNGNWYSTVQLIPSLRYTVCTVVNQGGANGMAAAYDLKSRAIERVPFI